MNRMAHVSLSIFEKQDRRMSIQSEYLSSKRFHATENAVSSSNQWAGNDRLPQSKLWEPIFPFPLLQGLMSVAWQGNSQAGNLQTACMEETEPRVYLDHQALSTVGTRWALNRPTQEIPRHPQRGGLYFLHSPESRTSHQTRRFCPEQMRWPMCVYSLGPKWHWEYWGSISISRFKAPFKGLLLCSPQQGSATGDTTVTEASCISG